MLACSWTRPLCGMAALIVMTSCVDGADPVGVDLTDMVQITAAPVFSNTAGAVASAQLDRARVSALRAGDGAVLAVVEEALSPSASEWVVSLAVELPVGQPVSLQLQVELAAGASVEWSGRTAPFPVTPGADPKEVRLVRLYRGPVGNLSVTGIELRGPESLLAGQSAALEAGISGGSGETRIFYSSLDPAVATVDASGRVQTLRPGSARLVASAGPASDTVAVQVREAIIADPEEVDRAVGPALEESGRVTGAMGDPAGAAAISSALADLGSALASRDAVLAVRAFEGARNAWAAYGATSNLRLLDAPLLGLIEILLIHAADALGVAFG